MMTALKTKHRDTLPASYSGPTVRPKSAMAGWGILIIGLGLLPLICAPGFIEPLIDLKWGWGLLTLGAGCGTILWRNSLGRSSGFKLHGAAACGAGAIALGLLLSALHANNHGLAVRATLRELGLVAAMLTLAGIRWPRAAVEMLCKVLIAAGAIQCVVVLTQAWAPGVIAQWPKLFPKAGGRAALMGTLGNPEYVASWLGAVVAAALFALAGARERGARLWYATAAGLGGFVIWLGAGRGAFLSLMLALAIAGVAYATGSRNLKAIKGLKVIGLAAALLLTLGLLGHWLAPAGLQGKMLPSRFAEMLDPHSTSLRHRFGLWCVTCRMIRDHWLLGAGPGHFGAAFMATLAGLAQQEPGIGYWSFAQSLSGTYVNEAHCDALQWWAEYGLLPVVGLCLLAAAGICTAWRKVARTAKGIGDFAGDGDTAALCAAWLVLGANSLAAFPLHEPVRAVWFWVLLGFVLSRKNADSDARETA
jgi:O-antigen ligase